MRAILFDGQLRYCDQQHLRLPQDGEVIVDVLKAGICETDLQLCKGYMGFRGILGHEFAGIARSGRYAGRRVVGEINCSCDVCDTCRRGLSTHCPNRTVVGILAHDGAFADQVLIPEANLHLVPEQLSDAEAVFVEPVAAACRIPQQIELRSSDVVTVLGDGRLGNLCSQVLRHHGCQVTVVGKHDFKLDLLRSLGIPAVRLSDLKRDRTSDIVVDCTGSPTGLPLALQLVRPCGTIVQKTTVAAETTMQMAPIVIDEVRIVGSRCGPFDRAIELMAAGHVNVRSLISAEYALSDGVSAFEHAIRKDALKVLLDIGR